jgi:hypothetical protein
LVVPFELSSCGGSNSRPTTADDGHGHGASYACGTESAPVTLLLKSVVPDAGSTVPNRSILHQFTLVDPPFLVDKLKLVSLPKHTAGSYSPNPLQLTVDTQSRDHVYSMTVDAWSVAPSHVEIGAQDMLSTESGCVFVFPSPVFSYDLTST